MIFLLNVATIFEEGSTVEIWTEAIADGGNLAPSGDKLGQAIVGGGQLAVDLPQDGKMYTLASLIEGAWRLMRVTTSAPSELTVTDVFTMLEELTAEDLGAEAVANKDIDPTMAANSDVHYPSQKAVATALAAKLSAELDTDSTMAANSDARVPSQKAVKTALALKEATANKGQPNGYAGLEAAGKVPVAQLPAAIMEYQGTWNATTNTPVLADGTGNTGDVYRVAVAGEHNFGSGAIEFQVGDYAIYNAAGKWEKSDTTDAVASVAGKKGVVTLAQGDIEGLTGALEGKQPVDADLTAIAALATTAFGRGLLTSASAAAVRATTETQFAIGRFYNVKDPTYGAKGDGATDDSAAIQAALTAANVAGGGVVYLPPGVYVLGTALTFYSNITLQGAGDKISTLKVKNAGNIDVLVSSEYATLTGTNSMGGIHDFALRDFGIDGNRTNQTTGGVGLKVYGYRYCIENLRISDCAGDNMRAEWSNEPNLGAVDNRDIEAFVTNLRSYGAKGKCILWKGPHDSMLTNIFAIASEETTRGLSVEGNGYTNQIINLHCWGKFTEYGLYIAPGSGAQYIINPQLEGGTKAQAFFGDAKQVLIGGEIFDGGYGVETIGIEFGAEGSACYVDTYFINCDVSLKFTGNGANSVIRGVVNSTEGTVISGTPAATVKFAYVAFGAVKDNRPTPSVASAAELELPAAQNYVSVSGATTIEKIKGTYAGHVVTLRFTGVARVKDTFPLNLQGEFAPTAGGATLTLSYDGEEWNEVGRSLGTEAFQEIAAAATITIKGGVQVVKLTGATEVKKINATYAGHVVVIIQKETAKLVDGENLKLKSSETVTADDTITLACDGTNWYEVGRSAN